MAAAGAPAGLEGYGRLPAVEEVAISPDGAKLAVVTTHGDERDILIVDAASLKPLERLPTGNKKVRGVVWAGPRHLIVTTSSTSTIPSVFDSRREWWMAVDFDLQTQKARHLLFGQPQTIDATLGQPQIRMVDGRPFAFLEAYHIQPSGRGYASLFKTDLDAGRTELLLDGEAGDQAFLVDADGKPLAREQYEPRSGLWRVKVQRQGIWRTVLETKAKITPPSLAGLGREADSFLVHDTDGETSAVRSMRRDDTDLGKPVVSAVQFELLHDPSRRTLIGWRTVTGDDVAAHFFDAQDEARWRGAMRAYPADRVVPTSMSDDHNKLVVLVYSAADTPAYALIDFKTGRSRWIGDTYPSVDKPIAAQKPIAFTAADGLPLTGYLTLPPGRPANGLPLVVYPHGGPQARDELGYDWWAQAMASRGYAVLQVNFRGSGDLGEKFLEAGFGQYGRKMQTDLSDGVRWLAAQGIIDAKRVCIVGASYGGYAALAGATLDAGVYRCAVAVAGISDMRRMVSWDKEHTSEVSERYWRRYVGVSGDPKQSFDAISPIAHLDAIHAPILLIHGKDDTVVPYEQSQMMADALRRAGKSVDLLTLESEDHWLSRSETRLQMLKATLDFLQKNNPPG